MNMAAICGFIKVEIVHKLNPLIQTFVGRNPCGFKAYSILQEKGHLLKKFRDFSSNLFKFLMDSLKNMKIETLRLVPSILKVNFL